MGDANTFGQLGSRFPVRPSSRYEPTQSDDERY